MTFHATAENRTSIAVASLADAQWPPRSNWRLDDYQRFGNEANSTGEALLAYDIASDGLKAWPEDHTLKQIQALSLSHLDRGKRRGASS
jgi:hypothetical protein